MDLVAEKVKPEVEEPWMPKLFGKQWGVFNSRARIVLVEGPRLSAKTWAVLHKLMRHMWETPGAQVGIFAKTKTVAKDLGVWNDLTTFIIDEWLQANIGLEWVSRSREGDGGPNQDGATRTPFFSIRNYYGGVSECRLFSLDYEGDVAAKVKQKRFSMIYFPELSVFKDPKVLAITLMSLRMPHLTPPDNKPDIYHQWIADTNQDEVLGKSSWIYQTFHVAKDQGKHPNPIVGRYLERMEVHYLHWKDNPFVTQEQIDDLYGSTYLDPNLHQAHYEGIWPDGTSIKGRHLVSFFNPPVHIIGGSTPEEGDQIEVAANSVELFTGWDIGMVNHAALILDRWFRTIKDRNGNEVEQSCWSVLDENVVIGDRIEGLSTFTHEFMDKMEEIEKAAGREFLWVHYCDSSATTVWRPSTESYDAMEIQAASNGQIKLIGVEKPDGSLRARVRILKMLLQQNRIFFSSRCVYCKKMLEKLGESPKEYIITDENKHPFDALTYVLITECSRELLSEAWGPKAREREEHVISI